jgi:hypothetical protein
MLDEISNSHLTNNQTKRDSFGIGLREGYVRYFFVGMAILFPLVIASGFTPSYVAMNAGQFTPHWFVHIHAAIMATWLLLFLTQSVLAVKENLRFHRRLGQVAAVFGILVALAMITASTRVRIADPPAQESFLWDVLLLELYIVILFIVFFTWGILVRKNAAAHKRLLLVATLVLIQAGIDRTRWLPWLGDAIFVRFIYLDLFLIPLLVYDLFNIGKVHRITVMVSAIIVALQIAVTLTWGSMAWHRFWFNRITPFVERVVEIKLNSSQLDLLVGEYGDKNWAMAIVRDGDKLFLKLPDFDRMELSATSPTQLFLKVTNWKISFVRGPEGKITKVINTEPNKEWEAARYK